MTNSTQEVRCPGCGEPVTPKDTADGHCLRCLGRLGFDVAPEIPGAPQEPANSRSQCFGDYELGRQLGVGGMGEVYEARDNNLNRSVALKLICSPQMNSPAAVRRFAIGAEAAAKLDHPNIVPIFEFGEHEHQPFLTMKMIHGKNLKDAMRQGEILLKPPRPTSRRSAIRSPQHTIARLVALMARAVHHAHEQGVIHRDIKPANILIDADGTPHLTDFGLAKLKEPVCTTLKQRHDSISGTIAGTPAYMSPEQACGLPAREASDIFSLGVVLYELLTGRQPFQGKTPIEILRKVGEEQPRRPRAIYSWIDPELETICLKCLEKNPDNRYATAAYLADDLERWMEGKPIHVRPATLAQRTGKWIKRNPIGAMLIGSLFCGLTVSAVLLGLLLQKWKDVEEGRQTLLREWMADANASWLVNKPVHIPSRILSLINEDPARSPVPFNTLSYGFIARPDESPSLMANYYADYIARVESQASQILGENAFLDLIVFNSASDPAEVARTNRLTLLRLNLCTYFRLQNRLTNMVPLLQGTASSDDFLLLNHVDSPVVRLKQLPDKPFTLFSVSQDVCLWTQLQLFRAGFHPNVLHALRYVYPDTESHKAFWPRFVGQPDALAIANQHSVLEQAGESWDTRFRELLRFPPPPEILLVQAHNKRLQPRVLQAFQTALTSPELLRRLNHRPSKDLVQFTPIDQTVLDSWQQDFDRLFPKTQTSRKIPNDPLLKTPPVQASLKVTR